MYLPVQQHFFSKLCHKVFVLRPASKKLEPVIQSCSVKKVFNRNLAKFTGKYLCQSLFVLKLQGTSSGCFWKMFVSSQWVAKIFHKGQPKRKFFTEFCHFFEHALILNVYVTLDWSFIQTSRSVNSRMPKTILYKFLPMTQENHFQQKVVQCPNQERICWIPLEDLFWCIHAIICSLQHESEMPGSQINGLINGLRYVYTLLELVICNKEKKLKWLNIKL